MWEFDKSFEKAILRILDDLEKVKKEPNKQVVLTEQDLRELIDLALMLDDKEWFLELTERLNTIIV